MVYATNPKATFDYHILESIEAGIVLDGHEVKAIKSGKASIKGAYVKVIGTELYLVGSLVSPYQPGNVPPTYDPQRNRKLLIKKSELEYIFGKSKESGITMVPVKIYGSHGMIKLEIGLARGKKKYDKREDIKKRDIERETKTKFKK